jgi:hypothetical protein
VTYHANERIHFGQQKQQFTLFEDARFTPKLTGITHQGQTGPTTFRQPSRPERKAAQLPCLVPGGPMADPHPLDFCGDY